jgi:SAM-dependent methyltransferase
MSDRREDDNLSEFLDGAKYDCEFGAYEPAGPFYETLADQAAGPILELACGTGRVAIPLARKGYDLTGIDLAPGMLAQARAKSDGLAIRWAEGDCRRFALGRRFALAYMTGNAFQAYLTDADQRALLAAVRGHLPPDGRFAFETRNPREADLHGHEAEEYWHSYVAPNGRRVNVALAERYDPATRILDCHVFRYWADSDAGPRRSRILIRYTDRGRLNRLLAAEGFAVEQQYGDFDRSPWTPASERIATVARLAPVKAVRLNSRSAFPRPGS